MGIAYIFFALVCTVLAIVEAFFVGVCIGAMRVDAL